MKTKLVKKDNKYFVELSKDIVQSARLEEQDQINISIEDDHINLSPIKEETMETPPPLPKDILNPEHERMKKVFQYEVEKYWNMAADKGEREKFMGSMRPILRAKLGYDYTEIICEQEAKKLCRKYYMAQERGEKLEPPYLPEI